MDDGLPLQTLWFTTVHLHIASHAILSSDLGGKQGRVIIAISDRHLRGSDLFKTQNQLDLSGSSDLDLSLSPAFFLTYCPA